MNTLHHHTPRMSSTTRMHWHVLALLAMFIVAVIAWASKADALEKTPRVEQTEMSAISSALVRETSTVGTSPVDDVTPTVVATTEMVVWSVIQNNEASGGDDVCWTTVAVGSTCAASTLTCSGAATDGIRIRPLESQTVKYAPASVRLCIVASAAATPFHVSSEVIP